MNTSNAICQTCGCSDVLYLRSHIKTVKLTVLASCTCGALGDEIAGIRSRTTETLHENVGHPTSDGTEWEGDEEIEVLDCTDEDEIFCRKCWNEPSPRRLADDEECSSISDIRVTLVCSDCGEEICLLEEGL